MIILHASFLQRTFFVWGESPADAAQTSPTPKGRKPSGKSNPIRPLPHDAGAAAVLDRLSDDGLEFAGHDKAKLLLWVPTVDSVPIASSPLIADPPQSNHSASLHSWSVSAMRLQPGDAVELLCRCIDKELLSPGLIVGKDLTYWATAMQLAASIVVRQQFLPGLARTGNDYRAHWAPVFTGSDHDRVLKLAKAMPHVCRAVALEPAPSHSAQCLSSLSVLSDFIGLVVDYFVRAQTRAPLPEVSDRRRLRASQARNDTAESIHDRWLHALGSVDGAMSGEPAELALLAQQIAEWRRPIAISSSAPFRLCFRLEEPDGNLDSMAHTSEPPEGGTANGTTNTNGDKWRLHISCKI
jgi:hypothetical protein